MAIEQIVKPDFAQESIEVSQRFIYWTALVSDLDILSGTGSPEGVVEAKQKRLYMDEAGTAGAILYIKRDADVAGDRRRGWYAI